jgi:cell division protein FtsL
MTGRILVALLVAANVVSGIGIVFARHEHRQLFIALTKLEKARDELNIEFGRLQLEQATWAESNRIDQVARTRLGMVFPETRDIVVLQPTRGAP